MTKVSAARRATFFTVCFATLLAVKLVIARNIPWELVGLVVLLLLHTWFSLRAFLQVIAPHDRFQQVIDVVLGVGYVALIATLHHAFWFYAVWVVFFLLSFAKYALLPRMFPYPQLRQRKMHANVAGVMLGVVGGVFVFVWPPISLMLFGLYALVTVYYLCVRPLYSLEQEAAVE